MHYYYFPVDLTKKSLSVKRKIYTTGQNCLRRLRAYCKLKQYKNRNLVKSFLKSRNSGDAGSWKDVLITQLTPICLQWFFLFFQKDSEISSFFFLVKNLEILLCDCSKLAIPGVVLFVVLYRLIFPIWAVQFL